MKFPYKKFFVQSPGSSIHTVSRPVIPIHVHFGKFRIAYETLVDSGADYSVFHAEIGEAIGIGVKKGKRVHFAGVSGVSQKGFRHPIKLGLGKQIFDCSVVFAFGLGIPYGILGQSELFKQFVVVFDRESGWLKLRPRRTARRT